MQHISSYEFVYFFRHTEELKEKKNLVFANCKFEEITQIGCSFEDCQFINCTFSSCLFHRCDFRHCSVSNCTFSNCNFYVAFVEKCSFRRIYAAPDVELNESVVFDNQFGYLDYEALKGEHNSVHSNIFYNTKYMNENGYDEKFWRRNRQWNM